MPYYSPHKLRHGNAVYSLKNAKDISALKAVSQNLMHANLSITDGVYGILSENDVRQQISFLGKPSQKVDYLESEIPTIVELVIKQIKKMNAS